MIRRLIDFVTNMDARAWRTVAVSFVLFGGVGVVFLFGAQLLGVNGEAAVVSLAIKMKAEMVARGVIQNIDVDEL